MRSPPETPRYELWFLIKQLISLSLSLSLSLSPPPPPPPSISPSLSLSWYSRKTLLQNGDINYETWLYTTTTG
jgi:hypothetical protein